MKRQEESSGQPATGIVGTILGGVSLAGLLSPGGLGGLLGGMPPGGPPVSREMLALATENAQLKAERYSDQQTRPLAVTQAQQGAQIECLQKQIELQAQITDGKINNVAQTAASGLQCLAQTVAALQAALGSVTKLGVPEANIIPAPTTAATGG